MRSDGQDSASSCAHAGFHSIGAIGIYRRDFAGPGDGTAVNVVAGFVDSLTARRTYKIWANWHDQCKKWSSRAGRWDEIEVYDTHAVRTSRGQSFWWLTTFAPAPGDPNAVLFEANGVIQVGKRFSLVVYRNSGQDYNYAPGHEPIVRALRASARRLG